MASRRLVSSGWLWGEHAASSPLKLENSFSEGMKGPVRSYFTVALRARRDKAKGIPGLFPVDIALHQKVAIVLLITLTTPFRLQMRFLEMVFIRLLSGRCLWTSAAFTHRFLSHDALLHSH